MRLVQGQVYLSDEGRAAWLEQAARSVAQQSTNVGVGAEERASWLAVFDVDETTGELSFVQGWHRDEFGVVRDGLPVADGPSNEPAAAPDWVQPTGTHDAYPSGAQVTYQGAVWESTAGANVWAPGVYGWVRV